MPKQGTLNVLRSNEPLPTGKIIVTARLGRDGRAEVRVEEKVLSEGGSLPLIETFPHDPFEVGNDSLSSVSNYQGSTRFQGKINQVKLKL